MSKAADDYAYIRNRLNAIDAEKSNMIAGTETTVTEADWPGDCEETEAPPEAYDPEAGMLKQF